MQQNSKHQLSHKIVDQSIYNAMKLNMSYCIKKIMRQQFHEM